VIIESSKKKKEISLPNEMFPSVHVAGSYPEPKPLDNRPYSPIYGIELLPSPSVGNTLMMPMCVAACPLLRRVYIVTVSILQKEKKKKNKPAKKQKEKPASLRTI